MLQNHSDLLPFVCNYCQKTFKHKRSRDRHIKIHTGQRPYKCANCDKAYIRSDHLKIHMKNHDEMKPHRCLDCNSGFSTSAALTSHIQKHRRAKKSPIDESITANNIGHDGHQVENDDDENGISVPITSNRDINGDYDNANGENSIKHSNDQQSLDVRSSSSSAHDDNQTSKQQRDDEVTCGLCGNKCKSLEVHIRENHLHHLFFAGLLQNSFYSASALANWQQLMPPPSPVPDLIAAVAAAASSPSSSSSISLLASNSNTLNGNANGSVSTKLISTDNGVTKNRYCDSPTSKRSKLSSPLHQQSNQQHSTNGLSMMNSPSSPLPFNLSSSSSNLPFLCNQCSPSPSFPDFESFRVHLKSHLASSITSHHHHPHHHHHHQLNPHLIHPNLHSKNNNNMERSSTCLPCPYCESMISFDSIESHIINYHLCSIVSSFSCESCKKVFTKSDDLTKHYIDYHSHHLYQCSICREMFDTDVTLQVHFAVKHSNQCKVFKCSICNQIMLNQNDFKIHLQVSHFNNNNNNNNGGNGNGNGNNNLVSPYLNHHNQHYSSAFNINHHLPSSLVTSTSNLISNINNQFSLFPSKCQYFKCSYCSDQFNIEYLLEKHIQSVHGNHVHGNSTNNNNTNSNNHLNHINDNNSNSSSPKRSSLSPVSAESNSKSSSLKRKSSEIVVDNVDAKSDSDHITNGQDDCNGDHSNKNQVESQGAINENLKSNLTSSPTSQSTSNLVSSTIKATSTSLLVKSIKSSTNKSVKGDYINSLLNSLTTINNDNNLWNPYVNLTCEH